MNELVWTKEPPTVPDWYWVRMGAGDTPAAIEIDQFDIQRGSISPAIDPFRILPFSKLEFAGPLPKPKEPGE